MWRKAEDVAGACRSFALVHGVDRLCHRRTRDFVDKRVVVAFVEAVCAVAELFECPDEQGLLMWRERLQSGMEFGAHGCSVSLPMPIRATSSTSNAVQSWLMV